MADLRVLKLALLAETKDFTKGLDKAEKNTKTFSKKLSNALKKSAVAFAALGAAAGAAAIKFGTDAVKAAIEDEQSQVKLAQALRNSTKATDAQIKSTEKYITKAQNATGVTDIELRQALGNLVRATGDVTKAQELNNLALDIAAATGKNLDTVTQALSKAYQGQTGALTRLDPSITAVIKSGGDADEIFAALTNTFGGAAAANAETFAGRMELIKRRVEDAQEAIGFALLPKLEDLSKFIQEKLVPAFEGFVKGLTGSNPKSLRGGGKEANAVFDQMAQGLDENENSGYNLGAALRDLGEAFARLFADVDEGTGPEGSFARFLDKVTNIVEALEKLIDFIDRAVKAYKDLKAAADSVGIVGETRGADPISRLVAAGVGKLAQNRETAPTKTPTREPNRILFDRLNRPTNVNIRIDGSPDPQRAGRDIIKVVNKNTATTGVRFVGIPGR